MLDRKISIIGLGYVGLPVAVAFGEKVHVIAFDINEQRIKNLKDGIDTTFEIKPDEIKNTNIFFTSSPEDIRLADFHIVAVPTPINKSKQPDLAPLLSATKTVASFQKH